MNLGCLLWILHGVKICLNLTPFNYIFPTLDFTYSFFCRISLMMHINFLLCHLLLVEYLLLVRTQSIITARSVIFMRFTICLFLQHILTAFLHTIFSCADFDLRILQSSSCSLALNNFAFFGDSRFFPQFLLSLHSPSPIPAASLYSKIINTSRLQLHFHLLGS